MVPSRVRADAADTKRKLASLQPAVSTAEYNGSDYYRAKVYGCGATMAHMPQNEYRFTFT